MYQMYGVRSTHVSCTMYYADTARRLGENSKENPFSRRLMFVMSCPTFGLLLSVGCILARIIEHQLSYYSAANGPSLFQCLVYGVVRVGFLTFD